MTILKQAFAVWGFAAGIPVGLVIGLLSILPFWLVPRGRREKYTIHGASLWARLVVRWILLARVQREGPALPEDSGALVVCNHRSWLDPLMLLGWTGSNGLSKREILYIPVVGFFGWLAGAVFFDRRDRESRAKARSEVIRLIAGGQRLQLFPEGTRSRDGTIAKRVFLALVRDAYNEGLPAVPCGVMGTEKVLPPGVFAAFPFQTVQLRVGEAMHPVDFASEEDFAIAVWARVKELVAASEE